jgi:hypothetical protein
MTRRGGRLLHAIVRHRRFIFSLWQQRNDAEAGLWLRRLIVTTLAVLSAWSIGSLFDGPDALVASILTLITLRVSLHASVNEAVGQLVGVGIGVGIAFSALALGGDIVLAVAIAAVTSHLSSRLLGLGDEGAVNIAITSLIVLGPGNNEATASDRVWGTLIGVVVAVVFSYWMHPSSPVGRTLELVTDLHRHGADLLGRMSRQVTDGYSLDDAMVWLHEARELVARIPAGREQAHEARRYARWYPWARPDIAEAAFSRFVEAEHAAVQVRTIARSLLDIVEKGRHLPTPVRTGLADALSVAGETLTQQSERVQYNPTDFVRPGQVLVKVRALGAQLPSLEDPGTLALAGAIAAAIERISDTLNGESAALTDVPQVEAGTDTAVRIAGAVAAPVRTVRKARKVRRRR